MKRLWNFVLSLGGALLLLAILISWYILDYQTGTVTMSNMMGQMMGNQYSGVATPMPTYVWLSIIALISTLAVSATGVIYYVTYPEIKQATVSRDAEKNLAGSVAPVVQSSPSSTTSGGKESWSMLLRTSKPEEKSILEVLSAHNGVYLQKLIVKESGLSKLKTHRIVSRFSERGIVSVAKTGNTNEVRLSSWLNQPSQTEKSTKTD